MELALINLNKGNDSLKINTTRDGRLIGKKPIKRPLL